MNNRFSAGKPVITIERMVACGGLYIGRQVAAHLSIPCLDQEILAGAARQLRQDELTLVNRDERVLSFGEKLLAAFGAGTPENEYAPPPFPFPEDEELFAAERTFILHEINRSGGVVIGHGGSSILRDFPGVVRIFCHAPLSYRVKRLMDLYAFDDEKAARRAVEEQTRNRERYLKVITGRDWKDLTQYDLCIDTSTCGLDAATELILGLVASKNSGG